MRGAMGGTGEGGGGRENGLMDNDLYDHVYAGSCGPAPLRSRRHLDRTELERINGKRNGPSSSNAP